MFSLTILVTLAALLGVVVTSAAQTIYGVSTWNPLQVRTFPLRCLSLEGLIAVIFLSGFRTHG